MGSGFVVDRTTDFSSINKSKDTSAKVRASGPARGFKSRKNPQDSKLKTHSQTWRATSISASKSESMASFVSVEELGKATYLAVFNVGGSLSSEPNDATDSSTMEVHGTEIVNDILV